MISMESDDNSRRMQHFIKDQIEWTTEKYSLSSLKEEGHFKLPALIRITSGYFGIDESDTFSSDEILVLYEWKLQERVLAMKDKVSISLPLDFEHRMKVLEPGKPGRLLLLSQIVQNYEPPVQVRFGPGTNLSFTLGLKKANTEKFGTFTLLSSHLLEYVTASTTAKGTICTEELVCLPIYRKVRFGVATHLHGEPMDQQRHYFHMFLDHMQTTLTLGILEYTELLDSMDEFDYTRIMPCGPWGKTRNDTAQSLEDTEYSLLRREDDPPHYETVETDEPTGSKDTGKEDDSPDYELIEINKETRLKDLRKEDDCPHYETVEAYEGTGLKDISQESRPGMCSAIKGSIKHPHLLNDLPVQMNRDAIYINDEIPFNPSDSPAYLNFDPSTSSINDAVDNKQEPNTPVSHRVLIPNVSKPSRRNLPVVAEVAMPQFLLGNTRPNIPPKPVNFISNKPKSPMTEAVGMKSDTISWMTSRTPNLTLPGQSPSATSVQMPIPEKIKHTIADSTPIDKTSHVKGTSTPTLVIQSLQDVPADLSDLSVHQVCQCLELLNLGEFCAKFRQGLIDGRVLKGCSVDDLRQEFSMRQLSARKLAMFVNDGWRPKE